MSRPVRPTAPAAAAALACTLVLAACGGGGGDAASPGGGSPLSQSEATADASDGTQAGAGSAGALDAAFDSTQAVAGTASATIMAAGDRARALGATAAAATVVACAGGGTATVTVTGAGPGGALAAGEHVDVAYASCRGALGLAQLDGGVAMDVVSISADAAPVTTATLALTGLSSTTALGTVTLDGSATLARSQATDEGGVTTTTSQVTASSLALATAFNARSGRFTLTDVAWTRTTTASAGVLAGSQFSGHHTLGGSADGFTFTRQVSTVGGMTFDATGHATAGQWTTVRPDSTLATTIAAGSVTITLDVGNDGSVDRTWTFPLAQLDAAAG